MNAAEVFKKLRLDSTKSLLVVNAPAEYAAMLDGVKYDNKPSAKKSGGYDFVQVFAASQEELERLCLEVGHAGKEDCIFWACYPKGTGKIKSDIKRETVLDALALIALRPVSQVAIDETWSAMRGRPADKVGQ